MSSFTANVGRMLIAALFIFSGASKLIDPTHAAQMIEAQTTLPGGLAKAVGIFEVFAGLVLATGVMNLLVSILLIMFTTLATLFFHSQISDPTQAALALKNLAIVGGLMNVFAHSQARGRMGIMRERERRFEAEVRDADGAEGNARPFGQESLATG